MKGASEYKKEDKVIQERKQANNRHALVPNHQLARGLSVWPAEGRRAAEAGGPGVGQEKKEEQRIKGGGAESEAHPAPSSPKAHPVLPSTLELHNQLTC